MLENRQIVMPFQYALAGELAGGVSSAVFQAARESASKVSFYTCDSSDREWDNASIRAASPLPPGVTENHLRQSRFGIDIWGPLHPEAFSDITQPNDVLQTMYQGDDGRTSSHPVVRSIISSIFKHATAAGKAITA